MQTFQVTITITCEDAEQAHEVVSELLAHDLDLDFDQTVEVETDMREVG